MMGVASVVISGVGVVSAAGLGVPQTLRSFADGMRTASPAKRVKTVLTQPVFEVEASFAQADEMRMRTYHLAEYAVREALQNAQLSLSDLTSLRVGVCLGTTVACQLNDVEFLTEFRETGAAPMAPVDRFLQGNLAEAVAALLGAKGPCITVTNACASGTDAIGLGASWIRAGVCDVVVAGGADELNRVPMAGFNALGILSPEICRPFDRDRQGLNLGEGAGILILEHEYVHRKRGGRATCCVAGYGSQCDAYHLTAPRPDGACLRAAIDEALAEARIGAKDLACVNAHGTATPENDKVEGRVLADILCDVPVPVLSTKGYTGHTLGAAGGLEAAFCVLALQAGWIPASAGFQHKDDDIPLEPTRCLTHISGRFALSTSLAFGGGNSALVIGPRRPSTSEGACHVS